MKKGFTLLELLVVVAIMGVLGFAATNSYSALVRGMRERGAVTSAASLLRAARERAHVDRLPTAVFCYNRLLKAPTSTENGVVVGMMTVVRQSGRLSFVQGKYLCDEFADLDKTYEVGEDEGELRKGGGFRLFRFSGANMNKMEYSIVSDRVVQFEKDVYLASTGTETNHVMGAYYDLGTSANAASWKTGDAYAFAFGEMTLPEGIIFGTSVPRSTTEDELVQVLVFDPESDNDKTIDLSSTRPDASGYPKQFRKVGTASSDADRAI